MGSLLDNVIKQETNHIEKKKEKKTSAVSKITAADGTKDKQISAKVNAQSWNTFSKINKIQGVSNNSAINMIINKYIRENKGILEE